MAHQISASRDAPVPGLLLKVLRSSPGWGGRSPPWKEDNSSLHPSFKAAGAGCTAAALLLNSTNPNLN